MKYNVTKDGIPYIPYFMRNRQTTKTINGLTIQIKYRDGTISDYRNTVEDEELFERLEKEGKLISNLNL